jgi:hypothetical protein
MLHADVARIRWGRSLVQHRQQPQTRNDATAAHPCNIGHGRTGGSPVVPVRFFSAEADFVNVAVNVGSACSPAMRERLFEALDAEWAIVGSSQQARASIARWAESEPALTGIVSPAEAVERCRRAEPAAAAVILGAVLRHAREPLAARTVLQAVVPALRAQAARRVGGVRHLVTGQGWQASDDFDADVVELALARIAALAGTSPVWPAQAICEATWTSLRARLGHAARRGLAPIEIDEQAVKVEASPSRTDAESLALAVAGAVRAQWLALDDARVIYATRVLGLTPAEVAAAQGRDVRALRTQRRRAERRLVHAGWAPATGMAPCRSAALASSSAAAG